MDQADELEVVGTVYLGVFYQCRNGTIVGPMIEDGREPSFGYAAALGGRCGEEWYSEGWSANWGHERDLVREVAPPLVWTGQAWELPQK